MAKLKREPGRYDHWCPGCGVRHPLPDGWAFDGDLERPTFTPSFAQGWTDDDGEVHRCHYTITSGEIHFHGDSDHGLRGATIPMVDLPPEPAEPPCD